MRIGKLLLATPILLTLACDSGGLKKTTAPAREELTPHLKAGVSGGSTGTGGSTSAAQCLTGWRANSPCGAYCVGQTQADRNNCKAFLDCYSNHNCGPSTCGGQDQVCGVNVVTPKMGSAPKDIADLVYECMACPGSIPATSCSGKINTTPCTDGNGCTNNDKCQAGACVPGLAATCTESDQCHDPGTCDPTTGACSHPSKVNGTACDDGNACTQSDTCQNGICTGANPVACGALDQCHDIGVCDPTTGVCSNPVIADGNACDDGNACTQTDYCQSGTCVGINPITCGSADQCNSAGTCDPATGTCSSTSIADGTTCDDGNPCTQTDTCQSGRCIGSNPVICTGADPCRGGGMCNPTTGMCTTSPSPDGTPCQVNECMTNQACAGGSCQGGSPVINWTLCGASDPCNTGRACQSGVCNAGQSKCDDGDPCTTDSCDPSSGACTHSSMTSDGCTATGAQPVKGSVTFKTERDNNRCVPEALLTLDRMNARGELIGLHYAHAGYTPLYEANYFGYKVPKLHLQAIVRLPYFDGNDKLDGRYFVSAFDHLTHALCTQYCAEDAGTIFNGGGLLNSAYGENCSCSSDELGSHLGVAKMGFRGGNSGKMIGSNRSYNYNLSGPRGQWDVTPNPDDTFIQMTDPQTHQLTSHFIMDPQQNHPGGASALGSHIAVALQGWDPGGKDLGFEGQTPATSQPLVKIYDLADPSAPQLRSTFLTRINSKGTPGTDNEAAAITKLADGEFLLAVSKGDPLSGLEFYVSRCEMDIDQLHLFDKPDPECYPNDPNSAQFGRKPDARSPYGGGLNNMTFITDCSGDIYLLAFSGDFGDDNADEVQLFKVNLTASGDPQAHHETYQVDIVEVQRKHMYCSDNTDTDQCDFGAGASAYVDPDGQVLIYAMNYLADGGATSYVYGNGNPWLGSSPAFPGFIRGLEFHQRRGSSIAGTSCPNMTDAWAELYADPDFNNNGQTAGQYYRIDFSKESEKNGRDMGTNDFNAKASSARWCIQAGSSIKLFSGTWAGSSVVLNGTGQVAEISSFVGRTYPSGGGNLNDSLRSYFFQEGKNDPSGSNSIPDDGSFQNTNAAPVSGWPQGLTCGLGYYRGGQTVVSGACEGHSTASTLGGGIQPCSTRSSCAQGFHSAADGDRGLDSPWGLYHQALSASDSSVFYRPATSSPPAPPSYNTDHSFCQRERHVDSRKPATTRVKPAWASTQTSPALLVGFRKWLPIATPQAGVASCGASIKIRTAFAPGTAHSAINHRDLFVASPTTTGTTVSVLECKPTMDVLPAGGMQAGMTMVEAPATVWHFATNLDAWASPSLEWWRHGSRRGIALVRGVRSARFHDGRQEWCCTGDGAQDSGLGGGFGQPESPR